MFEAYFEQNGRNNSMFIHFEAVINLYYYVTKFNTITAFSSETEEKRAIHSLMLYSIGKFSDMKGTPYMALALGLTGEMTTTVVHENTAAAVGAGGVEVFGTPMMIALMENAAWRAVAEHLEAGQVTIGTLVNVRHLGATPLGQQVRATAELIEIDSRRLLFKVEAYDEQKKIGEGQHERAIINLERFLQRLGQ